MLPLSKCGSKQTVAFSSRSQDIYIYVCVCVWSFASAEAPLLTVFSYTGKQKPLEIARFLRLTLPKTPQCTVLYSVFML